MVLRNVVFLPHHCMALQPEDGGNRAVQNGDILFASIFRGRSPEDGDSMILRKDVNLPHHRTASQAIY